jgi:hypothetical protein
MSTAICNFNSPGALALLEAASVLEFAINPNLCPNPTTNYDESIEQTEANGRDSKQIHGSDVWREGPQEGAPSLTWRPPSLDHIFGHCRLPPIGVETPRRNTHRV